MKNLKNILSFIAVVPLLAILVFLPLIPQAMPYEALTPDGGFFGVDYELQSFVEVLSNPEAMYAFPHNQETRRYNLITIVFAGTVIFLLSYLEFRLVKKFLK